VRIGGMRAKRRVVGCPSICKESRQRDEISINASSPEWMGAAFSSLVPWDDLARIAEEREATQGAKGVRAVGLGVGLAGYAALIRLA